MSRVVELLPGFFDARLLHAPNGSPEDKRVRRTIAAIVDEDTLPGPADRDDIRTPWATLYARPVRGTDLVVIYEMTADRVVIHALRPAAW